MKHFQRFTVWMTTILLLGLVACSPTPPPPLPTVAFIPSSTITLTPSRTLTKTPTPTFTPSNTSTPTSTITLSPTITLTPSDTPTTTDTPTNTPTDTRTPTDTPLPTLTRTATNTPTATVAPTIKTFTATPNSVQARGAVVVSWDADADKATLDELTSGNALIESVEVGPTGNHTFVLTTANGTAITFRLTAYKGGNTALSTAFVTVTCASPWAITPAPAAGCPQAAQPGAFTTQSFERGIAFFIPNTNQVYFLASNGAAVNVFTNTWNQSIIDPTRVPPSGLTDPTGPIGYVWHNRTWSDGETLQSFVGWGSGGSQNYNGTLQIGPSNETYITGPTGRAYRLNMNGTIGTWVLVG